MTSLIGRNMMNNHLEATTTYAQNSSQNITEVFQLESHICSMILRKGARETLMMEEMEVIKVLSK
jgi:hypothetical protein